MYKLNLVVMFLKIIVFHLSETHSYKTIQLCCSFDLQINNKPSTYLQLLQNRTQYLQQSLKHRTKCDQLLQLQLPSQRSCKDYPRILKFQTHTITKWKLSAFLCTRTTFHWNLSKLNFSESKFSIYRSLHKSPRS